MTLSQFLTIAIAHLFAVASPGPDFAVVFRHAIAYGRAAGQWTSAGVALGILLHVSYSVLGVGFLLSSSPRLFQFAKIGAAVYLVWLGYRSLRSALKRLVPASRPADEPGVGRWQWLFTGFLTNGLNPKVTLFFLALFSVVIDSDTPLHFQILVGLYLSLATFAWFAMLSMVMGIGTVRGLLLRAGTWFEGAMGVILMALGVRLAFSIPALP
ncbi:MAG: LysE family transporter [Gammaproteobacteria bacterium]|nr:LysE family transporter [Pseudomonadales bacterium]MCP5345859.1 LysE family transporter [Pseudomonadales bacterium]